MSFGVTEPWDRNTTAEATSSPSVAWGTGKGYRLCHRRMLQQHVVDFLRGYFLPTAIDDLAYAPSEKQVPVVIEETNISCLEPIACKCGHGRGLVAVVGRHNALASQPGAHTILAPAASEASMLLFSPCPWNNGSIFMPRSVSRSARADTEW